MQVMNVGYTVPHLHPSIYLRIKINWSLQSIK